MCWTTSAKSTLSKIPSGSQDLPHFPFFRKEGREARRIQKGKSSAVSGGPSGPPDTAFCGGSSLRGALPEMVLRLCASGPRGSFPPVFQIHRFSFPSDKWLRFSFRYRRQGRWYSPSPFPFIFLCFPSFSSVLPFPRKPASFDKFLPISPLYASKHIFVAIS